jgi:hypothetical protein
MSELHKMNEKEVKHVMEVKDQIRPLIASKLKCGSNELWSIGKNCILTGGAIPSLLLGETPNDYDLLFNFAADFAHVMSDVVEKKYKIISEYLIKSCEDYQDSSQKKCVTDWAVTLNNDIQFIFKLSSFREDFDFIHTMPYYDIIRNKLYISKKQYYLIMNRIIEVNPNYTQPIQEKRVMKYVNRGWAAPQGWEISL